MSLFRSVPADAAAEAERVFAAAAAACVPSLEALAAGLPPLPYLNEAKHLAPTFRAALADAGAKTRPAPEVSPTLGVAPLRSLWPRLGPFDASLRWGNRTVYGELKCARDEGTLEACAWDALKCAFALRHGFGTGMLLLAGAPKALWDRRARGCELFDGGQWDAADLRVRYVRGFTTWERDGYKPVRVPERLRTLDGPRIPLDVNGEPWLLALARVEPVGEGWLDWQPVLAAKATDGPAESITHELIDPAIEEQNTREINDASFRRLREDRPASANARSSERSSSTAGVNRTPFEIFYDSSLPLEEKQRLLEEVKKRPRSDEELNEARSYLQGIARSKDYMRELGAEGP